jgi:hypothetical protein
LYGYGKEREKEEIRNQDSEERGKQSEEYEGEEMSEGGAAKREWRMPREAGSRRVELEWRDRKRKREGRRERREWMVEIKKRNTLSNYSINHRKLHRELKSTCFGLSRKYCAHNDCSTKNMLCTAIWDLTGLLKV